MDISVIIPTRERPAKLAECLRCLRQQVVREGKGLTGRFEVLVGVDGPDGVSAEAAERAWRVEGQGDLRVIECPRSGLAAVRNRVMELARGRWILSINDDVYARPGFIETHAREQLRAEERGREAVVVGDSPWRVWPDDSVFDRLVRETSMVFFYNTMEAGDPERDWGFRHCFGLNFSVSAAALRDVGGFSVFPATYGYEDNEVAWRLREAFGMPVLYRPAACAEHDHRYGPREYLEREEKLGYAAWGFAMQAPGCASEMFGREITSDAEVAYCREFVDRERAAAARVRGSLEGLADVPSDAIAGEHAGVVIEALYQQHLLLKRWMWRRGLAQAAAEAGARVGRPAAVVAGS